jgi:hypothetical protein
MYTKKFVEFVLVIFTCSLIVMTVSLSGCGGSGGAADSPAVPVTPPPPILPADPNALNDKGIRNDIQEYIERVFKESPTNKAVAESYARKIQYAYTKVTTKEEAKKSVIEIIRDMNCLRLLGAENAQDPNSPIKTIDAMTINTPELLDALVRFQSIVGMRGFPVSHPEMTKEEVCDSEYLNLSK